MSAFRIETVLISLGPPDGAGCFWTHVRIVAVPVGRAPTDRARTVGVVFRRLDAAGAGKPPSFRAVGLSRGRSPFVLSVDVPLGPGRYELAVADGSWLNLFTIAGAPRPALRILCEHRAPRSSFIEGVAGFTGRGEILGHYVDRRVETCCRKTFLADARGLSNHHVLSVLLPLSGVLHVRTESRSHLVKPGEYVVEDPAVVMTFSGKTRFPFRGRHVAVSPLILKAVLQSLRLASDSPFGFSSAPRKVTPALLAAFNTAETALRAAHSVAGEHGIRAALSFLVFHLLAAHPHRLAGSAPAHHPVREPDARLKLSVEYFGRHLAEPYRRLAVARAACTSDQHLRRLFNLHFHKSPREVLQDLRVEEAKRLLADPELKLAEVARRVGYRDARAFQRIFKRLTEHPSRDFRPSAIRRRR